jgi:hypothetical protein
MAQSPQEPVETGSRREEQRYEPSPGHVVKVTHTFPLETPAPAQMHSPAAEHGVPGAVPGLQDAVETRERSSVWDARPVEDGEDEAGR